MKYSLILVFTLLTLIAGSQTPVKQEDVSKHVGDSVTVCGKVAGGRSMDQSETKITLLNVGGAFPNQAYSIVISSDIRIQFGSAPETLLLNKEVCVTGKVSIYRERPQIVISRKDQIQVCK